ncbi:uncharacterized protein N7483_011227 [Penicillium malachiteum]|uniref:uncharacterized protein n=1 Tax=Penicillium malachiteum TaxID=1324776 RepID=UPI002547B645|nr:uncharacterized protein N7483_011227 [Penicillium malachiteum]KAJ5714046.1 hypothetical protein N7483_011227 [Penicillium malachiteum]
MVYDRFEPIDLPINKSNQVAPRNLEHADHTPRFVKTTARKIDWRTLGCSFEQQLPILMIPEVLLRKTGSPFTNYFAKHLSWKKQALPWISDEKIERLARDDLKAMQLGFPALDDEACALGLAACLTIVCYVDSIIEELEPELAEQCIQSCLAILDGADLDEQIVNNPGSPLEQAATICFAFYRHIIDIFRPMTAKTVLFDMKDMIAGQVPELHFKQGELNINSYEDYLSIRNRTFGLLPLLTIAEHYHLAKDGLAVASPDIALLKNQISIMCVGQNDVGGLEKDIELSNTSNSILVLAMLAGRKIKRNDDVLEFEDILRLFEGKNHIFVNDVIETWSRIRISSKVETEHRLSDMLITLSITHLEWVLTSSRYDIESVLEGDCVGS